MSAISASQNFAQLLAGRELGARDPLFNGQNLLIQNIKEGNYTKTLFNGRGENIKTFDVQNDLSATVSDTIKLWNLRTGECLWTFDPTPKVYWKGEIKIVEDNVICCGLIGTPCNGTIRIIDLQTGLEKASITDSQLEMHSRICIIGRRIFSILKDGNLGEWTFGGNFVQLIASGNSSSVGSMLFRSESFLVKFFYCTVMIHDVQSKTTRKVELDVKIQSNLTSVYIDGSRLYCGCHALKENDVIFFVIDLKNGEIIDQYRAKETFANAALDVHCKSEVIVWNILSNQEWVYFGDITGVVVAVNLAEKKHVVLGKHRSSVCHLVIEGEVLISASAADLCFMNQLKFWDLRSMKEIETIELPSLNKISLVSGKLLAAVGRSMVQWDYFTARKGIIVK